MTKRLLNLNTIQKITLILTTLLLLPMSSWATIYTTTGSPQTVTSDNETFYTWGVSSSEVGWEIRQNAASPGTITTSNDGASIICSNGCRIENFSLPANSSEYVWKIVIEGLTNNENVTATCSNESQYAFTPTSTPGVFVLTQPFSLSGGAQFRILIADKECTITNISVYTTTTNYNVSVAGIPVVGENANDILGDGDGETGSVSFDKNTNTLTLDGATINMQGIMDHYAVESSINDLNVKLFGYTSITIDKNSDWPNVFAYIGESNAAQLTLETEANSEGSYGKLYVSGISAKEYITKDYTITNQLQNSGEQTGWKYTEQSGTYSSVYIMFTEYYDLWIGGAHITSDNLMPVSGGTKYIPSSHTLHLAGYSYSDAISSKMQELIVEVDGENSLSSFSYIGTENGRIVFRTAENSQSTNTVNLQKDNGGVITGFYQVVIEEPLQLNSPGTISELSTASSAIISNNIVEYSIRIAGIQVNNKNASSGITGEGITGTIKYDNDTNTLTLNNATITPEQEAPGIDYHGSESLIIELIGTNKIISSGGCDVIQCSSILDIRPDITLKNGDGNPCSLELEGGSGNIISGFRNISGLSNIGGYGNNLVLVYDKDVCYVQNEGLYSYGSDGTGAPDNPVSNATIATDYHLRIGNVYVTNLNKDNVLSNTSNDGKLSYSPQTNTLSFNGAEILQKISIEQENLTIDLEGNNSITIKDEPESSAIIAETCSLTIKSTSKTGSLTLSSSGGCPLTQGITPTITKPLVSSKNIANEEVTMATIHPVYPPIASNTIKTNEGIFIYLENSEDNGGSGIIKYSIENADKSTGISNQTFSPETGISMTKPGTLTAWIELDSENKSTDLVGKFFGFKQKSIRKVYNGTDAVTFSPEIVPEIEDGDNITVTYEKESGNATVSENAISMSSYGSSMIAARLSQSYSDNQHTYKLNPDTIQIKVIAVPATPSIPEDNSIFLSTDKITISSTSPSGTTIYYKWDNGADKTYTNEISIEGSTLSAWVKYQPYSDAEPVYSDTISATYAIKTNIEGLIFTPSTITDIPYTSSAITPDFTISTQDGTTLTTNDYTLSYKQVVENTPTAVESAINVGSYILTIEGKGSYGGTKEMPFNIVKATLDWTSDSWTVPEPKSELNYTGEALDLITRASIPEGATIKYLTVFNPESYDYVERANEEWSTTTPTGNAPGNYAIFYKIEGGDNFEDWGPSEVGIKATIEKGKVSITAEDIRSTYTGEPITFDKNKVEISISSISKDGINFKYYVPNTDNPEEQTLLDNAPTNIGIYNVEISLNDDNYSAESITATLTIAAQAITSAMVTLDPDANLMYDGNEKHPAVIKVAIAADESVGAAEKVFSAETDYNVSYSEGCTNIGDYTATVTFKGNYSGEATATFTITAATMNVTSEGHSGTYDGEAHGIKVTAPEDATVKYRNQEGTYELTETPTYINAGSYEVYYQVTMDNYTTVTGSATVEISKADITPTVTLEGWTYGATANTPTITGNTGNGTVTYTYKAEGAETFVETAPETAGNYTIKASIAETANYNAGEATAEFTITAATMNVTAEGYEGVYDTQAHGITVKAPEGATVQYMNQEETYTLTEAPTYTDAGTYEVYYQVTMDNYNTVTGSETITISKANITPEVSLEGWTYGTTAKSPSVTGNTGEGTVTYTYKAEGAETFVETKPEVVGTHTIKASIAETTNYNAGEATTTFTITAATMNVTAEGHSGTYDGKAYGITVSAPEDATVMYGTQEGKYDLTESPTYTDADTYIVYYQVTMDNYTTVTGSATVDISKADITPTVSLEGWTYGTTAKSPSVTGNTGEGTVTYTYQAESAEIFTETMPEVVGTHTIKASIAETTNYNAGEATATFTITAATMTVTAKGYEGTYDGKAHGITVSAPEDATIKYGTAEGSYELNASPEYTAGGNYTVYYQVTMYNYATVTGSETVKISKAEAELEFDVPEESKVYATIGKEFTEPTLNNLKGLDVTFSSSDESVATVDKNTGKVTLKSAGLTYITATFAGNDNYNEFAVKYELRVKGSYNLWIDNVQVTSDNYNDILENQKFFYDLVNKWLIITNNETPVTVKSSMPELTIYLNGKSELERIYFDNQGNAQNTGTLSFFNYNDVPGKLTLDTNNDNGVISGFSSISFDDNTKLRFIDPDSCEYKDGLVKMTKPSQLGEIVKQVTIGQYIEPMANGDGISFGNIDSETNITNMTIEDKLLITATQHEEGSNEDDDYIDPNNGAFVMNTTNTSEDVEVLSQGVESGNKQPGSEDYADSFRGGITFMIPSGTGTIDLELMNEEGYMLMLKIGTGVPHEIVRYERATVVIDYNVDEPTYVYLYLEEKSIIGARRAGNNTRVGKRDKAHGTVFSVKVKAASVSSTNPLNNVEGATGNITIPDVNTTTPSGDDVPTKAEFKITNDENKANDDKWYTIDGQRINKPTQKGVYIRNRKKVVVK